MSDSSEDETSLASEELNEQKTNTELNFLPDKSRQKYFKAYDLFTEWLVSKGAKTCSETVTLSYFTEVSKTRQPSTLWSIYSMLKATLRAKHDIRIDTYTKLLSFLKQSSAGHAPKKSKVFTAKNVEIFLNEAPDYNFLATKVVLIIGVSGACRNNELLNLCVNDIKKHSDNLMLVKIPNRKTKTDRSFVISGESVNFIEKYKALRPENTNTDRFFLKYGKGKCTRQPMGINKLGEIPRQVASFLKLHNFQLYTGHCFRRTSAALLVGSGADLTNLTRHDRLKLHAVSQGCIEEATNFKSFEDFSTYRTFNSKENSVESTFNPKENSIFPQPMNDEHKNSNPDNNTKKAKSLPCTQLTNTSITVPNKIINIQKCYNSPTSSCLETDENMIESSDNETCLTPAELKEPVANEKFHFVPEKSRKTYLQAYDSFTEWLVSKGIKTCSETVTLSYFTEMSKTRQPTTLLCTYSMLKAMLKAKHGIHIETYPTLLAFLKGVSQGHEPKKSKTFTAKDVEKFLNEAPDLNFLATKVGLIVGVSGACRSNELLNLRVIDVEKHSENLMLIKLPNKKTKTDKSIVICGKSVNFVEKYKALRPENTKTDRFFLKYGKGKCMRQPIGINKLGEFPRQIASFLKLQDPQLYTGHCFRRTAAALQVGSGADLTNLTCRDVRKSDTMPEGCCDETINLKNPEDVSIRPFSPKIGSFKIPFYSPISLFPQSINEDLRKEREPESNTKETEALPSTQVTDTSITARNKAINVQISSCRLADDKVIESSNNETCLTLTELKESVPNTNLQFIPEKSRKTYLQAYDLFTEWLVSKGAKTCSDTVMLSYFTEISKTRQPSTLWSIYSMLKATLRAKHDIHIEMYTTVMDFLKRISEGHAPKRSKTFTAENVEMFLNGAPDNNFLAIKVLLIIGVTGSCRNNELLNLRVNDIEKHSKNSMFVKLHSRKTQTDRSFVISGKSVKFVEKYKALRPENANTDRFFLKYAKGKCMRQPMGINKLCEIPQKIAIFLKLKEPQLYTGHCFRRTSAELLVRSGADLTNLTSHARKSDTLKEDYIEESINLEKLQDSSTRPAIESVYIKEDPTESPPASPIPLSQPLIKKELKQGRQSPDLY